MDRIQPNLFISINSISGHETAANCRTNWRNLKEERRTPLRERFFFKEDNHQVIETNSSSYSFFPHSWRKSWMWQVSLSKSSLCDVRIFQRDISPAFDEGIQWTSNPMKSTYRFPTICKITSLKLCSIRWRKSREEMYMYIVIMYNNSNVKFDKVLLSRFNTNRVCKD